MSALEDLFAFHVRMVNLPEPMREYRFAAPRRFAFDFAWPDLRVAVEIEGGVWTGGRHTSGAGFTRDCEKYNLAALNGWQVFRFTGDMVRDGDALQMTIQAIENALEMPK